MKKSNSSKMTGIALALAAAGFAGCASNSSAPAASTASADLVHCYGVNKCGGHNDCKTASNACAGHGSCKGQGFVGISAKACDDVGGKIGS